MIFPGSHLNSEPTSCRVPVCTASGQPASESVESPPRSLNHLPSWATQALCDLAQGEQELRRLRERQESEIRDVNRGLEHAVLGVRLVERHLLERVAKDHVDAQQHLEQLRKENTAAVRVSQSLVDQRLSQLAQLREAIQRSGGEQGGLDQRRLLKDVSKLLQPWEITLSLKKVSFRPSSQSKPISLGNIQVQQHSLTLPIGDFGTQGQPLDRTDKVHGPDLRNPEEGQSRSSGVGAEQDPGVTAGSESRGVRVVRKIRLSSQSKEQSEEEIKLPSRGSWSPQSDLLDNVSREEELGSLNSDMQMTDLILAVPTILSNRVSEAEEQGGGKNGDQKLVLLSNQQHSIPRKGGIAQPDHNKARQQGVTRSGNGGSSRGISQHNHRTLTSTSNNGGGPLTSRSCFDLSRLNLRSDNKTFGNSNETGRASSPTDSLDSSYTFIVSSPRHYSCSFNRESCHSKSTTDLAGRNPPLIDSVKGGRHGDRKLNGIHLSRRHKGSASGRYPSSRGHRDRSLQNQFQDTVEGPGRVCRSLSMSAIEAPLSTVSNQEQGREEERKRRREKSQPALIKEEEGEPRPQEIGHLVWQFGKQGSGRADFTMPSGVHATPQGQLFVVDCGNARVQVTDPQGNILQQVSPKGSNSAAHRCRNYFDIAVNATGLIALSCVAERALLIFNRHGRHLRTFGGPGMSTRDELEAPRGVAVNYLDEFLVADIRRGTLTALKLDPKTGSKLERTIIPDFHRPYLVAACLSTRLVAVSERGSETGRMPRVKVLEPGWSTIRVLGACPDVGPLLSCPWGICIDRDGDVLVAERGKEHQVVIYPASGVGRPVVNQGLSDPRGLTLLPQGHLVVSDSMHHCIKIFKYK